MSFFGTTIYGLEVQKGNVSGTSWTGRTARSVAITNAGFVDIWGSTANLVQSTANETWEIASLDAADTLAGTGAQKVLVEYLDEDYVEQSIIADMNGVGAVTLNADMFRPQNAVVIQSGSGKTNAGDIEVRVSGGGTTKRTIMAGFSVSQDIHFTVPAGKTAFLTLTGPLWPKNFDGDWRGIITPFGTNTELVSGQFPAYQNVYSVEFTAPIRVEEKSDITVRAKSSGAGPVIVNQILELYLVDT